MAENGLIDLTKVSRPDIPVKLKLADDSEVRYRLPGNTPAGLMVDFMVLLRGVDEADPEDLDGIADLRDQIQEKVDELFAMRNADYQDGDVKLNDEELAALMKGLFDRYGLAPDEGGGDRPTEPEPAEEPEAEPEAESGSETRPTPKPRSERPSRRRSPQRKRSPSRSSTSSPT